MFMIVHVLWKWSHLQKLKSQIWHFLYVLYITSIHLVAVLLDTKNPCFVFFKSFISNTSFTLVHRCVMKMDHHCPWINTCVGHRNHARFIYFLLFAIVGCIHAFIVLAICMYRALNRVSRSLIIAWHKVVNCFLFWPTSAWLCQVCTKSQQGGRKLFENCSKSDRLLNSCAIKMATHCWHEAFVKHPLYIWHVSNFN